MTDLENFGQLVRQQRLNLNMSQEALATEAFGNPDRKSFISAVENSRLPKVTPTTAKTLCASLGLAREEVPASLRWPTTGTPSAIEQRLRTLEVKLDASPDMVDNRAIVKFLNKQFQRTLDKPISQTYLERLKSGVTVLGGWTGSPFSLQSFAVCYALSFLYVFLGGLLGFVNGDISVGVVAIFRAPGWATGMASSVLPFVTVLFLVATVIVCWRILIPIGAMPLAKQKTAFRLILAALLAGISCGLSAYLGSNSIATAMLFAVPCFAAISALAPLVAAGAGAFGGVVAGLSAALSSAMTDPSFVDLGFNLLEGLVIGSIIGSIAGLLGSLIAQRGLHLRAGQLAGSGIGISIGTLASLAGIWVASAYKTVDPTTLGLFSVMWLALPMANGLLDFVSLGISHMLAKFLLQSPRRGLTIISVGVCDLLVAICLMVFTFFSIGVALEILARGLNIETLGGSFLRASAADPWGEGLWLTIMVLSTAFWTLLHYLLLVAPLCASALTAQTMDAATNARLDTSRRQDCFDPTVAIFLPLRYPLFYGVWGLLAICPVMMMMVFPGILASIMSLGLWLVATLF